MKGNIISPIENRLQSRGAVESGKGGPAVVKNCSKSWVENWFSAARKHPQTNAAYWFSGAEVFGRGQGQWRVEYLVRSERREGGGREKGRPTSTTL
jgi:hypothetical protein